MQKQPADVQRKVIPRWREAWRTPAAELVSANRAGFFVPTAALDRAADAWRREGTPWSVVEFLSANAVLGIDDPVYTRAILDAVSDDDLSPGVAALMPAHGPAGKESVELPFGTEDLAASYRMRIAAIRRSLHRYPRNPIAYIEAARLHVLLGQNIPAS